MRRAVPPALAAALLVGCVPSITWTARSPDHRLVVEARARGGRSCLVLPRGREACHEAIALGAVTFSDSGGHLAYPARLSGRWAIVRDGRPGRPWDGVAAPLFATGALHLAYAALDSGRWRVVLDDQAGTAYDSLFTGSLVFDRGGRRLGYVAQRGDSVYAVVDGVESRGWDAVGRLTFSADGRRYAYVARSGPEAVVVVDDRPSEPTEGIGDMALSDDGDHVAWTALAQGRWSIVVDGLPIATHDAVRALGFAGGGGTPMWVGRDSGRERVLRGGEAGPAWDSVAAPAWSASGERWGYLGFDTAGAAVVLDGAVVARETWAGNLVIAAGSGRVAYLARRGDGTAVVDEQGAHPFDLLVDGSLLFLRDGRTWACLAGERRRRRLFVVVEGVAERPRFDWAENVRLLARDPSGRSLRAWVAAEAELALQRR
jgi:hypothetical protein